MKRQTISFLYVFGSLVVVIAVLFVILGRIQLTTILDLNTGVQINSITVFSAGKSDINTVKEHTLTESELHRIETCIHGGSATIRGLYGGNLSYNSAVAYMLIIDFSDGRRVEAHIIDDFFYCGPFRYHMTGGTYSEMNRCLNDLFPA